MSSKWETSSVEQLSKITWISCSNHKIRGAKLTSIKSPETLRRPGQWYSRSATCERCKIKTRIRWFSFRRQTMPLRRETTLLSIKIWKIWWVIGQQTNWMQRRINQRKSLRTIKCLLVEHQQRHQINHPLSTNWPQPVWPESLCWTCPLGRDSARFNCVKVMEQELVRIMTCVSRWKKCTWETVLWSSRKIPLRAAASTKRRNSWRIRDLIAFMGGIVDHQLQHMRLKANSLQAPSLNRTNFLKGCTTIESATYSQYRKFAPH